MLVLRDMPAIAAWAATRRTVLTIGNFDGVHLGHQAIVGEAVSLARHVGAQAVAMTFDPHPATVLRPGSMPQVLTPLDEKLRLLGRLGLDATWVAKSEPAILQLSAEAFITDVIVGALRAGHLVEGHDFCFGRDRAGDVRLLTQRARDLGFSVTALAGVEAELPDGAGRLRVSSSAVRARLAEGDLPMVAACLGRPYRLVGRVVRGRELGRTLGFPTANLDVADQQPPAAGVYAGRCQVGYDDFPAAVSVGVNLTVDPSAKPTVEAHLAGFEGDLYGQRIGVDLLSRLRPMRAFDSLSDLTRQIAQDVATAREAWRQSATL